MIIETKLQGFHRQLKYDKLNYPECTCGKCFKFYWNMLNIGSCGSMQVSSESRKDLCLWLKVFLARPGMNTTMM